MQGVKEKKEMRILDHSGDTRIIWDSDNADEVANARDTFERLKKKGYKAFSVKKGGEKDVLITEFDPDAEKMILVPPVIGG